MLAISSLTKRLAVSALLVQAEKICAAGWLPEAEERQLRVLVASVLRAHGLPSIAERPQAEVIPFPGAPFPGTSSGVYGP